MDGLIFFYQTFELVSSISEVPDSIDVERIFSHADGVLFVLYLLAMNYFVSFLGVLFYSLSEFFLEFDVVSLLIFEKKFLL